MTQLSTKALRGNPYRFRENIKLNTGDHFNNEENLKGVKVSFYGSVCSSVSICLAVTAAVRGHVAHNPRRFQA